MFKNIVIMNSQTKHSAVMGSTLINKMMIVETWQQNTMDQKIAKSPNCLKWPGRLGPPTIMNKATNCVKWPGRLGPPTMAKNGRENAARKRRKRKTSVRISLKKLGETKCLKSNVMPGPA